VALPVGGATLTGTLQAQLVLTSGCLIVGAPNATSGINLGTLDFGQQPSAFTGTLTAVPTGGVSGASTTQVICSSDVAGLSIAVNGGNNAGQGTGVGAGSRAMANGASYIPYEVYQDAGHTVPYPTTGALTGLTVPANGSAFALPIFGQVNKTSATALPSGTYTDTLLVTLTF
jgi:spore coat protein U-like protein